MYYALFICLFFSFLFSFFSQKETITLKRGGEKGLGFSIAGGRGSTPYKDGDSVNRRTLFSSE